MYIKSSHYLVTLLYNSRDFEASKSLILKIFELINSDLLEGPISLKLNSLLSSCHLVLGETEQAYKIALKGLEMTREENGERSLETASAFYKLGYICSKQQKNDECLIYLSNCINIAQGINSADIDKKLD